MTQTRSARVRMARLGVASSDFYVQLYWGLKFELKPCRMLKYIFFLAINDVNRTDVSYKFICVDALRPSNHLFSHVGTLSCLPWLNQY